MSEHGTHTFERHCDVVVIGGSASGLSAALQLARQRRAVIVVDSGEPRNAPAAHMHSVLGHDGRAPSDFLAIARHEVRSYGTEVLAGRALEVTREPDDRFRVHLTGGHTVVARRVLAATGTVDQLPDIDGVEPHWGDSVIHCPFCHGYEVRDRRVVHIVEHPMGLHPAALVRQLTHRYTIVVRDDVDVDPDSVSQLSASGVHVVTGAVRRIVDADDGRLAAVVLDSGEILDADAVLISTRLEARAEPLATLGIETVEHPLGIGTLIEVDSSGATSVPGVYAAGNVSDPTKQVSHAIAEGAWVGAMIAFSLGHEDVAAATRSSANATDWDRRYSGDQVWSGNPNATLVDEAVALTPGRALDVGAGEGGDAVWLAEHGWCVTANDVSLRALAQVVAEAERRGLSISTNHADANGLDPFESATFDLVTAHYASIPRTPDGRGVHNLLHAVAPGGVLLVVSHDLEPMRAPVDTTHTSRPFDPDAYVRVEDVVTELSGEPGWQIEVHEKRPRPPGAASNHHVDDVVLRARRSITSWPGG